MWATGLVSPGGELYLATKSTERRPELLAYTALAYTAVRTSLLQSPARSIVVVVDCCFSGKAVGVLGAVDGAVAVDLAQVHGGYVLTSAAPEELVLAPPGARHTAFMGELIGLLARGDPDRPPLLTLRHAYQYLKRVLPARGFPKPHRRASEWIDDLVLAPNPGYRSPGDAPPAQDAAGPVGDVCPYPGLAAFRAEDARWFFGQEWVTTELVGRLAARLDQACPLVLVGASGSGKSSLLRAGLLSALAAGTLLVPGSRTWPCLLLTPTADPVGELTAQIARLAGVEPGGVQAELVADPDGFAAPSGPPWRPGLVEMRSAGRGWSLWWTSSRRPFCGALRTGTVKSLSTPCARWRAQVTVRWVVSLRRWWCWGCGRTCTTAAPPIRSSCRTGRSCSARCAPPSCEPRSNVQLTLPACPWNRDWSRCCCTSWALATVPVALGRAPRPRTTRERYRCSPMLYKPAGNTVIAAR